MRLVRDGEAPKLEEVKVENLEIKVEDTQEGVKVTVPFAEQAKPAGVVSVEFDKEIAKIFIDGVEKTTEFETKFTLKDGVYTATINSSWATLIGAKETVTIKVVDAQGKESTYEIQLVLEAKPEEKPVTVKDLARLDTGAEADEFGFSMTLLFDDVKEAFPDVTVNNTLEIVYENAKIVLTYLEAGKSFVNMEIAGDWTVDLLNAGVVTVK